MSLHSRKKLLTYFVGSSFFLLLTSVVEVKAGENSMNEVRTLPSTVAALPSAVFKLPPVDAPAGSLDEADEDFLNSPEKRVLAFSKLQQEEKPYWNESEAKSVFKLGTSGFALKISSKETDTIFWPQELAVKKTLTLQLPKEEQIPAISPPSLFSRAPAKPLIAGLPEVLETPKASPVDGEIIVAQWGFLRPDDAGENRPFRNAETRPFSQPQKASEVSSDFVVESESPVEQDVAENRDQPVKIDPTTIDPNSVGNPNSAALVRMMYDEMASGLRIRQITNRYDMFRAYCGRILDQYAKLNTGNERDGRARLAWYDRLFRDPMKSVIEVEEFSRTIHAGLSGDHRHLAETLAIMREKLDIPPARNSSIQWSRATTPQEAVMEVRRCLINANVAYTRAISTFSSAELRELETKLYTIFCREVVNGHTIPQRVVGKRLYDIMSKMDRTGIHDAVDALLPLTDENFLQLLKTLPEDAFPQVMLGSQRVQRIATPAGDIIIGGQGDNVYDLDAPGMQDVICVIDLGGNDIYREGTCNLQRPIFVIIDLGGNDTFTGSNPGIQAGSILGVSMLLNLEGNSTYQAQDIAQGSTIGGAGILIDYAGNDKYAGMKRVQGTALMGVGLLIDKGGDDQYRAALFGQGLGHPGGFGVLEDCDGDDKYYIGGLYLDSYPEQPGYDAWGQGLGSGIRQVANGGIGMLLDGGGDDTYEYDFFAHGGGYWFGVGVARDFGGNDKRLGATLLDYYGKPRREARSQRFCCGFGCHYALGFLFDDFGDDSYDGSIMGVGMAWDLSAGFLCDFSGNDRYEAKGNMTQGVGAQAGIGVLFDYGGDDVYQGSSQGYANPSMSYHHPNDAGSNFSFLIDYGGKDTYGSRAGNNTYMQRGGSGGFLIDRPFDVEVEAEKAAAEKAVAEKPDPAPSSATPNRQPVRQPARPR